MEYHLKIHEYFAAGQLTVADIALYGYTHVADRCDYDLATFPSIGTWLRRVEQTPGFVAMDWQPGAEVDNGAGIAAEACPRNRVEQREIAGITCSPAVILPLLDGVPPQYCRWWLLQSPDVAGDSPAQ